ncbi:hypothetical protein ACFWAR_24870 [Streptomyces sp. NPDC059917]|uniref:hypothetical protein n=1 Tax=Streptomyces sp. NPDC059917 TaxID=3347002 RepID=UPI00364EE44F
MSRSRGRWLLGVGLPVALVAAGVAGWFVHDRYGDRAQSRSAITTACRGLIDPDAVMRVGGNTMDAGPAGAHLCVLRRAVTFEGQREMREFLSLTVTSSKDAEPGDSRFEQGARGVTAIAKCVDPTASGGVTSLRVTAATEGDGPGRGEPGFLAELARGAALRAAAEAGCAVTLPAAPKS